jgi:hypothetical protein
LNLGNGKPTDTYSAPTYSGGTQTLTKIPDPRSSAHSKIKGVWYVSDDAAITDHGNPAVAGSLAWVAAEVGSTIAKVILPPNKTYTIGTTLALNGNTTLIVCPGATISISSAKTLTLNGRMIIEGGSNPITGAGTFTVVSAAAVDQQFYGNYSVGGNVDATYRYIITVGSSDLTLTLVQPGNWALGKKVLIINMLSSGGKTTITGSIGGDIIISGYLDTIEFIFTAYAGWVQTNRTYYSSTGEADNFILNPSMSVWQRGTTFSSATTPANNDDTYLKDR